MKEKLVASYGRMTEGMLRRMQGNYTAFKIMFLFWVCDNLFAIQKAKRRKRKRNQMKKGKKSG